MSTSPPSSRSALKVTRRFTHGKADFVLAELAEGNSLGRICDMEDAHGVGGALAAAAAKGSGRNAGSIRKASGLDYSARLIAVEAALREEHRR